MTTAPATATPHQVATDILTRAHTLATTKTGVYNPDKFWTGLSDEQVSGEQVAHHLDATRALLALDGWTRQYQTDDEPDVDLTDDINTMGPTTILRKLIAIVRWEYSSTDKRHTLPGALYKVASTGAGDQDTRFVARNVLSTIIRAGRGDTENMLWLIEDAWSTKLGRTQDEVMALLATGAAFARQYGPESTSTALTS